MFDGRNPSACGGLRRRKITLEIYEDVLRVDELPEVESLELMSGEELIFGRLKDH